MRRPAGIKLQKTRVGTDPYWLVTVPRHGGGRTRKWFKKQKEAQKYANEQTVLVLNHGTAATALPLKLRVDAAAAAEILAPYRASLLEAARAYAAREEQLKASVPVKGAITALLDARRADGLRPRYLDDLRVRLDRFAQKFGDRLIAAITAAEIDDWLRALAVAPVTCNSYRRRLATLFSFSVGRRWAAFNPVAQTAHARETAAEPGILTPAELKQLLGAAGPETLPYWALGALGGLRSAELCRLSWEDISWTHGHVEVPALKSKTGRERRLIPLRPALKRILAPYRGRTGPLVPEAALRYRLNADRAGLGRPWPPNALRHSFASYHLARFRNAPALALELGHRNPDTLFRHYRSLVTAKAARAWWGIRPPAAGPGSPPNIIALESARAA
jgi:integrase